MDLVIILAATLVAGVGSVWVAGVLLRLGVRAKLGDEHGPQNLLSLAAGALLATAFMHLLPEAFHSAVDPSVLFAVLLFGLVLFFLLDKAELWHHGHEHGEEAPVTTGEGAAGEHGHRGHANDAQSHSHGHSHSHAQAHSHGHAHVHSHRSGGWTLLTGDSVHCFGDGVLIASAFVADWRLGLLAALAVLAHEVPHHVGDLVVLRRSSPDAKVALLKVSLAGTVTALGGLVGWWLVDQLPNWLPYLLVLASSSFVYVALADLIPQLQRRLNPRQTVSQVAWLVAGILLVTLVSRLAHGGGGHDHGHGAAHPAGVHSHSTDEGAHSHAHDSDGHDDEKAHSHGEAGQEARAARGSGGAAVVAPAADSSAAPVLAPSTGEAPAAVTSTEAPASAPTASSAVSREAHEGHNHGSGKAHRH